MPVEVRELPLNPIEHVFTGPASYAITFAMAYDQRLDVAKLRSSLREVLKVFWPLCSQLVQASSQSLSFSWDGAGAVGLEVAESDEEFLESNDPRSYITPVSSVPGEPLARFRLTQTPTGSVLGVSISHALVDGFSFFHFLASWARLMQGKRILAPSLDRTPLLLGDTDSAFVAAGDEVLERCGLFSSGRSSASAGGYPAEEVVPFSQEAIRSMKAAAQKDSQLSLTDNDVLTAYTWKEYGNKWTHLEDGSTVFVTIPFDFRRLLKGLPRLYFGCALAFITAEMDQNKLLEASLGEISSIVREAVGRVSADYALGSLHYLEALRHRKGLAHIQRLEVRHPRRGMIVTNISRLPIDTVDFGSGPPAGLRAAMLAERAVAILPADDGVVLRALPPRDG